MVWEPAQNKFTMWYRGGWGGSHIGVASSTDGKVFLKDARGPVYDGQQPHVFKVPGGLYWLQTNQGIAGRNTSIARLHDGNTWVEVKSGVSFDSMQVSVEGVTAFFGYANLFLKNPNFGRKNY